MTPEGKVKAKITKLLRTYGEGMWFTMPVPSGYGESTLDYLGCFNGRFFAIEAKKPGGTPTERQEQMMAKMEAAGGSVFVISCDEELAAFKHWAEYVAHFRTEDRSVTRC